MHTSIPSNVTPPSRLRRLSLLHNNESEGGNRKAAVHTHSSAGAGSSSLWCVQYSMTFCRIAAEMFCSGIGVSTSSPRSVRSRSVWMGRQGVIRRWCRQRGFATSEKRLTQTQRMLRRVGTHHDARGDGGRTLDEILEGNRHLCNLGGDLKHLRVHRLHLHLHIRDVRR